MSGEDYEFLRETGKSKRIAAGAAMRRLFIGAESAARYFRAR
jgi:hypothetical protein